VSEMPVSCNTRATESFSAPPTETVRSLERQEKQATGRMIGGLLRFAPGRLGARTVRAPASCGIR
jgi:hypothetical protein